jgi:hypothetical protein
VPQRPPKPPKHHLAPIFHCFLSSARPTSPFIPQQYSLAASLILLLHTVAPVRQSNPHLLPSTPNPIPAQGPCHPPKPAHRDGQDIPDLPRRRVGVHVQAVREPLGCRRECPLKGGSPDHSSTSIFRRRDLGFPGSDRCCLAAGGRDRSGKASGHDVCFAGRSVSGMSMS